MSAESITYMSLCHVAWGIPEETIESAVKEWKAIDSTLKGFSAWGRKYDPVHVDVSAWVCRPDEVRGSLCPCLCHWRKRVRFPWGATTRERKESMKAKAKWRMENPTGEPERLFTDESDRRCNCPNQTWEEALARRNSYNPFKIDESQAAQDKESK